MGATPFGYELARQFGLKIVETKPALVPFSWPAKIEAGTATWRRFSRSGRAGQSSRLREKMLIIIGLSGPRYCNFSYWEKGSRFESTWLRMRITSDSAAKARNMTAARRLFWDSAEAIR